MQRITPFLWFNNNAEAAITFYTSVFPDCTVVNVQRYGESAPGQPGAVMTATIAIGGQEIMLLNGGPMFKFTEAISLMVNCESQQEVDELWAKLTAGGEESQCGWLKDQFGLSWQIVPNNLGELLGEPDQAKAQRIMQAFMQMKKIDIPTLQRARDEQ